MAGLTKLQKIQRENELIDKQILALERREVVRLEQIKQYQEQNKSEFFRPLPYQQQVIDMLQVGKKTVVMMGANRTGKTTLVANLCASLVTGKIPWNGQPNFLNGKLPVHIRVLCPSWDVHANKMVETLKEWLPKGTYTTTKNHSSIEDDWRFKNGSTLVIMTYSQPPNSFESWSADVIFGDEPPPEDIYPGIMSRLVDTNGVFFIAMTAVEQPWILDRIVLNPHPSVGSIQEIDITQNTYLSPESIERFRSTLTEEDIEPRIHGRWFHLVGLILKEFDKDIHIIRTKDIFKIPKDWLVVPMIDIHPRTEQAVGFYTTSPYEQSFVVDEIWRHMHPSEIANRIIEKKEANGWRMKVAYIDPLAVGDSAYIRNVNPYAENSFYIIEKILRKVGIRLEVACKDKAAGIANLQKWLKGPNGIPSVFIFETCPRHIFEIMRWIYDKDTQLPSKFCSDHMMENWYRFTLTRESKYRPITQNKPLVVEGWKERLRMVA